MESAEIWKDVVGYEGLYKVSNLGKVLSLNYNHTKKSKLLKLLPDSCGYLRVGLSKNTKIKTTHVHRLVAIAFLNHNPDGYKIVVNHKDFNRLNNKVDNLELIPQRDNSSKNHIKSSSRFVGVSWHKKSKKWMAYIVIQNKLRHLGYFVKEENASNAYQTALKNYLEKQNEKDCKDKTSDNK